MLPSIASERPLVLRPTSTGEKAISEMKAEERRRADSNRSLLQALEAEHAALPKSVNPFKYNLFSDNGEEKFHQRQKDLTDCVDAYNGLESVMRYITTVPRSLADADPTEATHDSMRIFESKRSAIRSRKLADTVDKGEISRLDRYQSEVARARLEYISTGVRQMGDGRTCLKKAKMFTEVGLDGQCDSKYFCNEALTFT